MGEYSIQNERIVHLNTVGGKRGFVLDAYDVDGRVDTLATGGRVFVLHPFDFTSTQIKPTGLVFYFGWLTHFLVSSH